MAADRPEAKRKTNRRRLGYTYLRAAVDDHSRAALIGSPRQQTRCHRNSVGAQHTRLASARVNIGIDAVTGDNAKTCTSDAFQAALTENRTAHINTHPYRPPTNGNLERPDRTLTDEIGYNHKFRSEPDRRRRLQARVHNYNLHRHHTAIAPTPASRDNNLAGHYT